MRIRLTCVVYFTTLYPMIEEKTIERIRQALPPRSTGAPEHTWSHYTRILALLRERGPVGVLSSELYDAPDLYGRSPRNRISEIRRDGHLVQTIPVGAAVVRYILTHENPSPTPRPARRKVEQQPFAESDDWFGKPRPVVTNEELFLFDNLGRRRG